MADSRNTTGTSRRLFLAAGSAAAVFGSLSAAAVAAPKLGVPSDLTSEPVLVALEEYRIARNHMLAIVDDADDDTFDAASDAEWEARRAVLNARPQTRKGAEALARFAANKAEYYEHDIAAAIDTLAAFMFQHPAEG